MLLKILLEAAIVSGQSTLASGWLLSNSSINPTGVVAGREDGVGATPLGLRKILDRVTQDGAWRATLV